MYAASRWAAGAWRSARRAAITSRSPALRAAARPCSPSAPPPAARHRECRRHPATLNRSLSRVSGPIMDRIDVKLSLEPATRAELRYDLSVAESSATVAARVLEARERALKRMADAPWRTNSD